MMLPWMILREQTVSSCHDRCSCASSPQLELLHQQAGLSAGERLDLPLIDREDDGMGGRIDIKADDVAQLADELRARGELEMFHPLWLM